MHICLILSPYLFPFSRPSPLAATQKTTPRRTSAPPISEDVFAVLQTADNGISASPRLPIQAKPTATSPLPDSTYTRQSSLSVGTSTTDVSIAVESTDGLMIHQDSMNTMLTHEDSMGGLAQSYAMTALRDSLKDLRQSQQNKKKLEAAFDAFPSVSITDTDGDSEHSHAISNSGSTRRKHEKKHKHSHSKHKLPSSIPRRRGTRNRTLESKFKPLPPVHDNLEVSDAESTDAGEASDASSVKHRISAIQVIAARARNSVSEEKARAISGAQYEHDVEDESSTDDEDDQDVRTAVVKQRQNRADLLRMCAAVREATQKRQDEVRTRANLPLGESASNLSLVSSTSHMSIAMANNKPFNPLPAMAEAAESEAGDSEISISAYTDTPAQSFPLDNALYFVYDALSAAFQRNHFIQSLRKEWLQLDPELHGALHHHSGGDGIKMSFWDHVNYLLKDTSEESILPPTDMAALPEAPHAFVIGLQGMFDTNAACAEFRRVLEQEVVESSLFSNELETITQKLSEQWQMLDKEHFGCITEARLRTFVWRNETFADPGNDQQDNDDDDDDEDEDQDEDDQDVSRVERIVASIKSATGNSSVITFDAFSNMLRVRLVPLLNQPLPTEETSISPGGRDDDSNATDASFSSHNHLAVIREFGDGPRGLSPLIFTEDGASPFQHGVGNNTNSLDATTDVVVSPYSEEVDAGAQADDDAEDNQDMESQGVGDGSSSAGFVSIASDTSSMQSASADISNRATSTSPSKLGGPSRGKRRSRRRVKPTLPVAATGRGSRSKSDKRKRSSQHRAAGVRSPQHLRTVSRSDSLSSVYSSGSFNLPSAMHYLRNSLPRDSSVDVDAVEAKLLNWWSAMDTHDSGLVTEYDLRVFLWESSRDDEEDAKERIAAATAHETKSSAKKLPDPYPQHLEEAAQMILTGTGGPDCFTFWDFANLLLREQGAQFAVLSPYDAALQYSSFHLDNAIQIVRKQLPLSLQADEVDQVCEKLAAQWSALDTLGRGVATRTQVVSFVWEAYGDGPLPTTLPSDVKEGADMLMSAASSPNELRFWEFANMIMAVWNVRLTM
jgi:hypothetical protein